MASDKFVTVPGLPGCSQMAIQNGDPSNGPSLALIKAANGCVIPWHWHNANENLMFVSGKARVETKSGKPQMLAANEYMYLPSKHPHNFTCVNACTFFLSSDATFDIHYVDKDGNEISADQALKGQMKSSGTRKKAGAQKASPAA